MHNEAHKMCLFVAYSTLYSLEHRKHTMVVFIAQDGAPIKQSALCSCRFGTH